MAAIMLLSSCASDERQALRVLVRARALADKHQLGVRIAGAENNLLAAQLRQLATLAVGADLIEDHAQLCIAIEKSGGLRFSRRRFDLQHGLRYRDVVRRGDTKFASRAGRHFAPIERADAELTIELEAVAKCVAIKGHAEDLVYNGARRKALLRNSRSFDYAPAESQKRRLEKQADAALRMTILKGMQRLPSG